jgi:hypothetical protein
MAPDFETFEGRGQSPRGDAEPAITMSKGPRHNIAVNSRGDELLGKPPFVELLYDPKTKAVGVRACKKPTAHSYPTSSRSAHRPGFQISGGAFVAHYGIAVPHTIKRLANLEGNVLYVSLDDEGVALTSPNRPTVRKDKKR